MITDDPRPHLLDIIKVKGRWAQFTGGSSVKYLDNSSEEMVDLGNYRLAVRYGTCVYNADLHGLTFTESEISNIRWGPEQAKHPELRRHVAVFGEYAAV